MEKGVDRTLVAIISILLIFGFFVFSSASLGLLAREGARFSSVAFNQIAFGIIGGSAALFIASRIFYRNWRKYAFHIFVASIILTLSVFLPKVGMEHGGAHRWIHIGSFTFQPAEFLKITFIIYMATWLSGVHKTIGTFKRGTLPFAGITALVGVVMLIQPDTDTYLVMATAATAMFVTAGGSWRDVALCSFQLSHFLYYWHFLDRI